ncbi:hypothetical protein L6452_06607 [Arctium lappa]|uniref:Uncharacterized protein n=1 Tax=Arctium lappa TaxID=4217 RepID=A0ACB9EJD7_ARCLA|nr:hypothetical protein L6452_06607 [Arctium lappa]
MDQMNKSSIFVTVVLFFIPPNSIVYCVGTWNIFYQLPDKVGDTERPSGKRRQGPNTPCRCCRRRSCVSDKWTEDRHWDGTLAHVYASSIDLYDVESGANCLMKCLVIEKEKLRAVLGRGAYTRTYFES